MVPLMFAAMRQNTDSRKFLARTPNKEFSAVKKSQNKTMRYIMKFFA
jgi:hypothetical protein